MRFRAITGARTALTALVIATLAACSFSPPFPSRGAYNHPGRINERYDPLVDSPMVVLDGLPIDPTLEFAAQYRFQGRDGRRFSAGPDQVAFQLHPTATRRIPIPTALTLLVDGADTVRVSCQPTLPAPGRLPSTSCRLPLMAWHLIVSGAQVRAAIGADTVAITGRTRAGIEDFASRIAPAAAAE